MITDVIRNADAGHEVLLLLTTYVDAMRDSDDFCRLSESVTTASLMDAADVRTCLKTLLTELDAASRNLDDNACELLHEAVYIFGTALEKLLALEHNHSALLAA